MFTKECSGQSVILGFVAVCSIHTGVVVDGIRFWLAMWLQQFWLLDEFGLVFSYAGVRSQVLYNPSLKVQCVK